MTDQIPTRDKQLQIRSEHLLATHSIRNESSLQGSGGECPSGGSSEEDKWWEGQTPNAEGHQTTAGFGLSTDDMRFIMNTELLRVTPDHLKPRILKSLTKIVIPAGRRILNQGASGDRLFILHEGSCVVNLQRNEELHPIARLKRGDVFGEMAIITGDCRGAHVDAETDVEVWTLDRDAFDSIRDECEELVEFLTHLATERLCSRRITAERNIGRYRITDVIAEGGWSIVYKGFHSVLRLPVAVKMLKHSMALDSDFFHTFQGEAETIARLNHENIVRVYDVEQVYRTVFIIMEYLNGLTLRQIIDSGLRAPLSRILKILMQVGVGLRYAHENGVVHQDVKPGNIFVQEDDKVKIVDFGLAAPIGGCSDDLPGTPHYMAPEQIEGEPVDGRTDIYSLGITAYEMATGVRPYPDDICQTLEYHITKSMPDPREINPDLPEAFTLFVRKATEKKPESRYQNMSEALAALNSIAGISGYELTREAPKKRRMKSLYMFYDKDREPDMDRILDETSQKMKELGVELRLISLDDV